MSRFLVTGATGFLGKHLVRRLEDQGHTVYISNSTTRNLKDTSTEDWGLPDLDYIFHLACNTKAGDWCLYHSGEQWLTNQEINTNILEWWHRWQPQAKMIAMGTGCSYSPEHLPMVEDHYMKGEPDDGLYTYAMTKRMLYQGLRALNKQWGHKFTYFVPSTLYGPGHSDGDRHFIFDLVRKIRAGKEIGQEVVLWGDGTQRRELIYVDDAIELMLRLIDSEEQIINLAAPEGKSIREFAEAVAEILEYDPDKIVYDTSKYVGIHTKKLDTAKIQSLVPDFQYTPLKKGIAVIT